MYRKNFTKYFKYVIIILRGEMMIKRNLYLEKMRDFYDETSLIKIIYGLRRAGKSVILMQIMNELIHQNVDEEHLIYLNFESLKYSFIKSPEDLERYIKSFVRDKQVYYVFLDEIQKIEGFEQAINSLRVTNRFSIFVTGSNSRVTFRELSTDLSGRYVSFRVHPLTFREIVKLTNTPESAYDRLLHDIFEWGSLPQRFSFKNRATKLNYLSDVYDSILLKDIVDRLKIKDITTLNKILQYLLKTEGHEFSNKNVLAYLKEDFKEISTETLYRYIDALCSTFMVNRVYRYDVQKKEVLKTLNKFYVADLGIRKIKASARESNALICLENLIYHELIARGYEVYAGKTKKGDIDFVAMRDKEYKYLQVCYYLGDSATIDRLFGAYDVIQDHYPKYVVSLDKADFSKNGIQHMNAIDFLMGEEI